MMMGRTAGIGQVTALEHTRRDAIVVLVSWNPEICDDTAEHIHLKTVCQAVDYVATD